MVFVPLHRSNYNLQHKFWFCMEPTTLRFFILITSLTSFTAFTSIVAFAAQSGILGRVWLVRFPFFVLRTTTDGIGFESINRIRGTNIRYMCRQLTQAQMHCTGKGGRVGRKSSTPRLSDARCTTFKRRDLKRGLLKVTNPLLLLNFFLRDASELLLPQSIH